MWQGETGYRPPRAIALTERIPIALPDTGTPSAARRLGVLVAARVHTPSTEAPPRGLRR